MELTIERQRELEEMCHTFRKEVVSAIFKAQSGHTGGSLSACEILTLLYQHRMNLSSPDDPERDRLVLSKGHAAPMMYRNLIEKGFIPYEELNSLRQYGSLLQGHPSMHTPGVEIPSGPLGLGLAAGQGMALGLRMNGSKARVYVVLGDGELNEGSIWEAATSMVKYKVDNLCAIVDYNKVQLDGPCDEIMPMGDLEARWKAFGWHVIRVDGHDMRELNRALDAAEATKGVPTVIIADTIKGKGVSFMEGQSSWHGKAIDPDSYQKAMAELEEA